MRIVLESMSVGDMYELSMELSNPGVTVEVIRGLMTGNTGSVVTGS